MVTTLEVEVVDMATTRDISLTASLGEYFSRFSFSLFYITLILFRFLSFKLQKHKKILFVLLACLLLVICFMFLKTKKKEQKDFRFLESDAKVEVQEFLKSAHCFIFHIFSATPIELKF